MNKAFIVNLFKMLAHTALVFHPSYSLQPFNSQDLIVNPWPLPSTHLLVNYSQECGVISRYHSHYQLA